MPFGRGELSYSKVRAITRIARPETEADLLAMAREGTTAQIERLVRAYRRADPAAENATAQAQQEARWLHTALDRRRHAGRRGAADAGAGRPAASGRSRW